MRYAVAELYSKKKDVVWTVVGIIFISLIAVMINFLGAHSVLAWTQKQWILLICMLAIGLVCTLTTSSDFALIIQLYTIGILFFIGMNDMRTQLLLSAVVAISAISLHSMKKKLADLVKERNEREKKLQAALDELKKVDEMKDEVIFVASHDLRTPLSIIKLNLATIKEGYAGKINKEASTYIDAAYRASERLGELLEDLLEASVVEHSESMNIQPIQIEETVNSVVMTHHDALKHVKVKMPAKPYKTGRVAADPLMLHRVVENLVLNAAKYTKEGTITITVVEKEHMVRCSVADSGIGIPAEAQNRLFTKFYRAPNALNMQTRGSGLGLYITKQIIQRLRGKIGVESKLNNGSTFFFELPKVKS